MNVTEYLKEQKVWFQEIPHHATFTARSLASAANISGEEIAKTVLLLVDDEYILAVVPSTHKVDLGRVKLVLNADNVSVAKEWESVACFPDCDLGAMPPFGSKYGIYTIVDSKFSGNGDMVFETNYHDQAIRMKSRDFARIENPEIAPIARAA